MGKSKIRIGVPVADDHVIGRAGIRRLMEGARDLEVVARQAF